MALRPPTNKKNKERLRQLQLRREEEQVRIIGNKGRKARDYIMVIDQDDSFSIKRCLDQYDR